MNLPTRTLTLLAAGTALAVTAIWLLGWLAAVVIPAGVVQALAGSEWLAGGVLVFGMAAVPAAALAAAFGWGVAKAVRAARVALVGLCSLPWLAFALLQPVWVGGADGGSFVQALHLLLSWQLWPVVLAVPAGLWLGTQGAGAPQPVA